MAAGTSDEYLSIQQIQAVGLRPNHAYSILSIHEVKYLDKNVKLLKLRNPWGFEEWTGAWSNNS